MKKIITIILAALACNGVSAQLVSTTSAFEEIIKQEKVKKEKPKKEKKPRIAPKTEWYVKAGLNLMSTQWGDYPFYSGVSNPDIEGGEKISVGFNVGAGLICYFRPSNPSNFYWGFELGATQVGGGFDSMCLPSYDVVYRAGKTTFSSFALYVGPTIGWKKQLSDRVSLDVHLSPEFIAVLQDMDLAFNRDVIDKQSQQLVDSYSTYETLDVGIPNFGVRVGAGVWYKKFNFDVSYRCIPYLDNAISENGFSNILLSVGYAF